jgi:hypothetical protein
MSFLVAGGDGTLMIFTSLSTACPMIEGKLGPECSNVPWLETSPQRRRVCCCNATMLASLRGVADAWLDHSTVSLLTSPLGQRIEFPGADSSQLFLDHESFIPENHRI